MWQDTEVGNDKPHLLFNPCVCILEKININVLFLSFLNTEMTQVVDFFPQGRNIISTNIIGADVLVMQSTAIVCSK